MKIKKTLGGDRLGSGRKMQVELHGFGRSSHNLSSVIKTDQAAGTLVPVEKYIAMNGGDFYIKLDSKVRTLPTNGPIFGVFKHQIDVFQIPMRLYNAQLHNNELYIGLDMAKVKFPQVSYRVQKVPAGSGNTEQVATDSLTAYLGVSGFGTKDPAAGDTAVYRKFNAMFELAYWEIYKEYYANKQEEIGYVISGKNTSMGQPLFRIDKIQISNLYTSSTSSSSTTVTNPTVTNNRISWTSTQNKAYYRYKDGSSEITNIEFTFNDSENITETELFEKTTRINVNGELETIENLIKKGWHRTKNIGGHILTLTPPTGSYDLYIEKNATFVTYTYSEESAISIEKFELKNIDRMRRAILAAPYEDHFSINTQNYLPYTATFGEIETNNPEEPKGNKCYFTQSGLGIKTYQSDRFNNWLSTEWIDGENGINEITAVQVVDGKITMNALLLQEKVFNMMNRIAVSGGSFDDWQEVQYGERVVRKAESPIYEGGMSSEIYFDEVVSTSATSAETGGTATNNPLGSLAGRGSNDQSKRGANKMIHIHVMEPSIIMIIESITPRVTYSQGISWENNLETMDDLHVPSLDGIGFQDLITEEMAAFDSVVHADGTITKFSAGKQPSWIQYQTNVDKTFGDFAAGKPLEFMSLNRDYTQDETTGRIKDLTTYIDPTKYNIAFADAELTAKNFWVQIAVDCIARRKMSANQIPIM